MSSRFSFCHVSLSRENRRNKFNESSATSAEDNRRRGNEELSVQIALSPSRYQLQQYLHTTRKNPHSVTTFTTVPLALEVVAFARDSPMASELCRPRPLNLIKKVVGSFQQNLVLRRDARECQQFVHMHFFIGGALGVLSGPQSQRGNL